MQYDKNFEKIMDYTFKTEGGFNDNPNDLGGRTNLGVTQSTYNAWRKNKGLPQKDVKNITKDEAKQLYYEEFWKPTGAADKKDLREGYLLFDMAINSGPYEAKKLFKESQGDIYKFLKNRKVFYETLIKQRPSQIEHRKGWMNRLDQLESNMNDIVNKGYYRPPYYDEVTPYDGDFHDMNLKKPSQIKVQDKSKRGEEIQNIRNKYQYIKHKNNFPTGYAYPVSGEKTFTAEDIGKMSPS